MTEKKITKRERFEQLLNIPAVANDNGLKEFINHELELLAKKNARIIKVAKPSQDKRFDIPAIGLKTLKTMRKYRADLIAVEAGETIIVDKDKVVDYADRHNIVIMAV